MLDVLSDDPAVVLYALQAGTYALAAASCPRMGHRTLRICYAASATLYGLLGLCHLVNAG
jgi:hypothetical protein